MTPDAAGQSWDARHDVAANVFVPWIDRAYPLEGKTVLEYGSGTGSVACAFGARDGRHIGYDIDEGAVEVARGYADKRGLTNVEFHVTTAGEIFDQVRTHTDEIDVFLLYAVLEHLTISERLAALRLARDVVRPDGMIAVIETPNRLVDFDFHTSQLPFFDQLPEELGLAYVDRSERPEFRDEVLEARERDSDGGALKLARWGRGASFHEFELVFGDIGAHILAGGYDPDLLEERAVHTEERALARQLERVRPDLPPPFSRYWLDMLISPTSIAGRRPHLIRPWSFQASPKVGAGMTVNETMTLRRGGSLPVNLPEPATRLVCVLGTGARKATLSARVGRRRLRETREGTPGHPLIFDFELPQPAQDLTLRAPRSVDFHFIGYAPA
jgi:ubiquinone/menaquinone biosynthesis C-methylase UbiE